MRDLAQTVAPALLAAALRAPTEALLRPALGPPPPATAAAVLPFAVVAAFSLAGLLLGRGQQRHATGGGGSLAAAAVATATVPAAAVALGRAYASVRGLTGIPLAGFFVVAEAVLVAGPVACVRPRLPGAAALAAVAAAAMAVAAAAGDWVSGGDVLSWFLLPAHPAVMLVFVIGCACMALDAMIGGVGDGVGKTSAKSATVRGRRSKGSKAQANRTPASAAEHTRSWVSRRAWYLVSWVVLALLTIGAMPQFRPFLLPQVNSDGVRLVARSWSTTGLVSVVEDPRFHGGVRLLRCDHSVLGGVYTRPGTGYQGDSVYDVFYLLEFARAAIRNGAPKNALLIGLGTGIAAVELSRANISVVAVELDPAVARYAQEYFGVGVGGPASVTVIVGDGGAALEECAAGRYDLVVHDVFSNGGLPARLFSEAAMRAALRCLREGGVLALNIVGSIRSPLAAHVLETLEKVFSPVIWVPESLQALSDPDGVYNIVFYASASAASLSFDLARLTAASNVGGGGAVRATALRTFSEALARPQRPALGPSAATAGDKDARAQAHAWEWVASTLGGGAAATVGVGTPGDAEAHWSVMEDEFGSGFWALF